MSKRFVISACIVVLCVGTVVIVEHVTTPEPQERDIHLEAFRYGLSPSILRVNRGDRLNLTFSSRDTAHSFFLQDYRIDAKISPDGSEVVEVYDPLRATEPPVKVKKVRFTAGLPGLLGQLITREHRQSQYVAVWVALLPLTCFHGLLNGLG